MVEEIHRQLDAIGTGYGASYSRTGAGAEVDLVLEGNACRGDGGLRLSLPRP